MATLEHEDGANSGDSFRRAAFAWVVCTKRLVESSAALGQNTKVAYAALADIEHARDLLDTLFMPVATKTPAAFTDGKNTLTAAAVRDSVSGLATRIITLPVGEPKIHRGSDLSAPVHPKNGKMLWAGIDCMMCVSKAGQRCQRDDGVFLEKPHPHRKNIAEVV